MNMVFRRGAVITSCATDALQTLAYMTSPTDQIYQHGLALRRHEYVVVTAGRPENKATKLSNNLVPGYLLYCLVERNDVDNVNQ